MLNAKYGVQTGMLTQTLLIAIASAYNQLLVLKVLFGIKQAVSVSRTHLHVSRNAIWPKIGVKQK